MSDNRAARHAQLIAALLSPMFLGMAPVFGKLALRGGSDPFTVAAVRTALAAGLLWLFFALFWRRYTYIYVAGFLGCAVIGIINGIGSLMYYNGLRHLDASAAQLLNGSYLLFAVLLARLGGQSLSWRDGLRILLALFGLLLITGGISGQIHWLGVGLMLGNGLLFAGTVVLSQRVLYEMPAQTVTLYVITVMAVVVIMARVAYNFHWVPQSSDAVWAIGALSISTALSRLTLFAGVKTFGSLQTTMLAITEIAVALTLSYVLLDESLTYVQWVGVGAFAASLMLLGNEPFSARAPRGGVPMPNMAGIVFQQIAFTHAFGESGLSQEELDAIRRMMGAEGPLPSEPPLITPQTPTSPSPPADASD
ncbi:MAG: DMT family transporter [Chloroflexi bacterium]|jgi:drug/metabolite transporter (DMT)-like permease|nr:DMT family transporter [Chloroflexota bacterium]